MVDAWVRFLAAVHKLCRLHPQFRTSAALGAGDRSVHCQALGYKWFRPLLRFRARVIPVQTGVALRSRVQVYKVWHPLRRLEQEETPTMVDDRLP